MPAFESVDPESLWWCGHCHHGPMNIAIDLACASCQRWKDRYAYPQKMPRPPPRTRGGGRGGGTTLLKRLDRHQDNAKVEDRKEDHHYNHSPQSSDKSDQRLQEHYEVPKNSHGPRSPGDPEHLDRGTQQTPAAVPSSASSEQSVKLRTSSPGHGEDSDHRSRQERPMSYMRRFLESNGHSRWPKIGNDRNSIHNDLDGATAPALGWQRALSDNTDIDESYELVRIKGIQPGRDRRSRKEAQNLTRFLETIRHPHCVAYLGSYTRSSPILHIKTFPKAQCSLKELMDSVVAVIREQKQSKTTSNVLKSDGLRVNPTPSDSELRGSPALFFSYEDRIRILRRCFVCLPQALSYLHEHFLMPKDISPENILVDGSGSVLLADAGIEKGSNHAPSYISSTYVSVYSSPDLPRGKVKTLRASDIFSLGCVLLEVAALVLQPDPWELRALNLSRPHSVAQMYCDILINFLEGSGPTYKEMTDSEAVRDVRMIGALSTIREMLDEEPEQRPKAHGLWEKFKWVSLEICADCDPRHPGVWRSQALTTSATVLSHASSPGQLNSSLLSDLTEKDICDPEPMVPGNMSVVNNVVTSINEENATEKDLRSQTRDYLSGEADRVQFKEVSADPPLEAGMMDNSDEIARFEDSDLDESMESHEATEIQPEPPHEQASLAADSLFRSVLLIIKSFIEFLELREKPLRPGYRRIRWTCVRTLFSFNWFCTSRASKHVSNRDIPWASMALNIAESSKVAVMVRLSRLSYCGTIIDFRVPSNLRLTSPEPIFGMVFHELS